MLKLDKAKASHIETNWGKRTNKLNLGKQVKQANQAKVEKPKPPVITLLESLSSDRFKSVKKVDTEV